MAVSVLFLIVVPFLLAGPALLIWALVDLVGHPTEVWEAAGQDRLMWALIVILVGVIGPVLYLTIGRDKLDAAERMQYSGIVS